MFQAVGQEWTILGGFGGGFGGWGGGVWGGVKGGKGGGLVCSRMESLGGEFGVDGMEVN